MRTGLFQGRPAREFSVAVIVREAAYVLRCDTLILYEDRSWEARGALSVELPGVRIGAEQARRRYGPTAADEGVVLQNGSAHFYPDLMKIDFVRCNFRDSSRLVYEEAKLFLDQWGSERHFPILTVIMREDQLVLELPQERIYIDRVLEGNTPEAGQAMPANEPVYRGGAGDEP
jgi:hypothetical protein